MLIVNRVLDKHKIGLYSENYTFSKTKNLCLYEVDQYDHIQFWAPLENPLTFLKNTINRFIDYKMFEYNDFLLDIDNNFIEYVSIYDISFLNSNYNLITASKQITHVAYCHRKLLELYRQLDCFDLLENI